MPGLTLALLLLENCLMSKQVARLLRIFIWKCLMSDSKYKHWYKYLNQPLAMNVIILNNTHQEVSCYDQCMECKVLVLHFLLGFCAQWYIVIVWLACQTIFGYTTYILTGAPGHSGFIIELCAAQGKMLAFYSTLMTFSLSWDASSHTLL